jgi:2'-5' RNA ligase
MRAFVAIDLPPEVRARIQELLQALRIIAGHVRWAHLEGLHITLKFLGEVPPALVPEVEAGLRSVRVSEGSLPLEIGVRGSGFFPNERSPRVVWLGIEAGPGLAEIAGRIEATLLPLGFAKEDRAFSPHLTLGRIREPGPLTALREQLQKRAPLELGFFNPQDFFLYESQLARGGSIYRKVARFAITAGPPK